MGNLSIAVTSMVAMLVFAVPSYADQADVVAKNYGSEDPAKIEFLAKNARDMTGLLQRLGYSVTIDDLRSVADLLGKWQVSYNNLHAMLGGNPARLFVSRDGLGAGTCYDLAMGSSVKVSRSYDCFN